MIVEQRTYTLQPGRMKDYLRLFEDQGFAIYKSTLGHVIGVFSTEIGPLNQLVILAGYADLNDRLRGAGAAHGGVAGVAHPAARTVFTAALTRPANRAPHPARLRSHERYPHAQHTTLQSARADARRHRFFHHPAGPGRIG